LNHPGVVAGVVSILGIAGALIYAGGGAASVAYCLITDGAIVIAWLAAAAGWGAWLTGWLLRGGGGGGCSDGRRSILLPVVTSIAFGLGLLSLLELGLGLAGALGRVPAFGLVGLGWLLGALWLIINGQRLRASGERTCGVASTPPPRNSATPPPADTQPSSPLERRERGIQSATDTHWRWLWLLTAPIISTALVAAMFPAGMLWKPEEPHGYDAVEYHLQVPREWQEGGRIVPLTHNVFSYFPFGVEMHYLLAMQLKGGAWPAMYLAQLMHLAMVALAVAAACGFANQLASNRRTGTIASIAIATIPWLAQLAPLGFNEGGLLLFGTMSAGWALVAARNAALPPSAIAPATSPPAPWTFLRTVALAGAMAGFASGVKLTGVPLFLLATPLALLTVLLRRSPRSAFRGAILFGVAGTLAFSPWLIRNVAWSGNPVFPEGTALFGHAHFTEAQVQRWKAAHSPRPDQQSPEARLVEFGAQVLRSWQFGYILLPLGLAGLLVGWRRTEARLLALLLTIHAAVWLGLTHLQGRFFVPALPLAALALAIAPWERIIPGRGRLVSYGVMTIIGVAAMIGWWNVHERLSERLAGLHDDRGLDARGAILANEQILGPLLPEALWKFPSDDPEWKLILVGDAQAFTYPVPSARIRYRTPFDVREGNEGNVFDAYGVQFRDSRTWLRVDPDELLRFGQYYAPFPRVPSNAASRPGWQRGSPPYVVQPGEPLVK
jgi:hypothetical protein